MIFFILPNQLFKDTSILDNYNQIYIYEHPNYFTKYNFHKLRLVLHRSSMKSYYDNLKSKYNTRVKYLQYNYDLNKFKNTTIHMYDPVDHDIIKFFKKLNINLYIIETPLFIATKKDLQDYMKEHDNKLHQTSFYIFQRKRLDILLNKSKKPIKNKWTFDRENRSPYPKNYNYDQKFKKNTSKYVVEAQNYVNKYFKDNLGDNLDLYLPIDHKSAEKQLQKFLSNELKNFAVYQDASKSNIIFGHHSVLSPVINIGLLTHAYIIKQVMKYYNEHKNLLVQVEAYLRQIIGWNNYMRLVYTYKERELKKNNYFNATKKLDKSWYSGETNIYPIDNIIKKILKYGYAHHIERLMYLANFMLISGIRPKDAYVWFSEMFIDSYPVFMITNVNGMGLYASGSLMTGRPYFSSSNYIRKMSDYKDENNWNEIWNAYYYLFVHKNQKKLEKNYATANIVKIIRKFSKSDLDYYKKIISK